MSATILYRHPRRSDEGGMAIVPDQANLAPMKGQLEDRGYRVIKIVPGAIAKPIPAT